MDNHGTELATAVHNAASASTEFIELLEIMADTADENGNVQVHRVTLVAIAAMMRYQNKLMTGCHELQAEAMDRVETLIHSLGQR